MPRRRRPFPALAATLVTVALLVGCGVDTEAEVATTGTSETTESTEPSTTTTTASTTTTEPSDDGPGDGIGDDDGTIDDDGGDDSTTDDDGTTDGGDLTAFCEANADIERLDDELSAAIDEDDVAGFQRLYLEYLDAVDAAAAVAPDEIVDAVTEVSDILFDFIDEVEQATTVAELNAIPDDPAFDVEAFDEVESYTDTNC